MYIYIFEKYHILQMHIQYIICIEIQNLYFLGRLCFYCQCLWWFTVKTKNIYRRLTFDSSMVSVCCFRTSDAFQHATLRHFWSFPVSSCQKCLCVCVCCVRPLPFFTAVSQSGAVCWWFAWFWTGLYGCVSTRVFRATYCKRTVGHQTRSDRLHLRFCLCLPGYLWPCARTLQSHLQRRCTGAAQSLIWHHASLHDAMCSMLLRGGLSTSERILRRKAEEISLSPNMMFWSWG